MEALPVSVQVGQQIFCFRIPRHEADPLGNSDTDYSNVEVQVYDQDGALLPTKPQVAYWSNGALGALKGGLCNLEDRRVVLDKDAVAVLAKDEIQSKLVHKRSFQVLGLFDIKPCLYLFSQVHMMPKGCSFSLPL